MPQPDPSMANTIAQRVRDALSRFRVFWESVPTGALVMVAAAVFFLFSTLALTADISSLGQMSPQRLAIRIVLSGSTAAAWVLALARGRRFLFVAVALHVAAILHSTTGSTPPPTLDEAALERLSARLRFDTFGLTTAIMLGYALFIGFIASQGKRYMRVKTEIALATEIHQLLVPPIDQRIGRFEFFGASRPSGEVGGDLVDLIHLEDGSWVACLADVSGHGVASGTMMGMFKSAFRSRLTADTALGAALADVNRVMLSVRKPGMYVTGAFLAGSGAGHTLRFSLAGHPSILHYRAATRKVDELDARHTALALFEAQVYDCEQVDVGAGDILALVSDGLMEVFDRQDREFGLTGLARVLADHANRPLPELSEALVAAVRLHGAQLDDQSLLLVKRLPAEG